MLRLILQAEVFFQCRWIYTLLVIISPQVAQVHSGGATGIWRQNDGKGRPIRQCRGRTKMVTNESYKVASHTDML